MRTRHFLLALLVAALDLVSKWWIVWSFQPGQRWEVIPGFFNLILVRNSGVAFSLFHDSDSPYKVVILAAFSILGMIFITYFGSRLAESSPWLAYVVAAVLGGILGNLLDRLYNHSVVDFLDLHWRGFHWPTFNLADSAITLGTITLFIYTLVASHPDASKASSADLKNAPETRLSR